MFLQIKVVLSAKAATGVTLGKEWESREPSAVFRPDRRMNGQYLDNNGDIVLYLCNYFSVCTNMPA